jgi:hypothetical protein
MMGGRRITVRTADTIIIGEYEVEASVLQQMLDPRNRVLWAFVKRPGRVQAVAYDETRVVWLTDEDLVRADKDV